ncbi:MULTISPECIES: beta-ketoacyl-ACP synthase II [Acidithrix]|uniref:3-oxoacyl-[acyl-carrier-protein] synthase 2 n=1 Tax=Acidithrix ferrooxidans TaxID=1280514 RepID=A0A0D8HGV0_9ACTN|nr:MULTISPECIES: beta-ketoacyl-ACP synthase II [Acidithrix]KJF17074.1 3-oxoacyl-[acyl-carrier-protein] synthase 2 [Acidithrix ferrooxidans]CAG4923203.1 unnamed protein product [Acidithrix sp. C25]
MKIAWTQAGQSIEAPYQVAITGVGVVSSVGTGKEAFWNGINQPEYSGSRLIPDFDPSVYMGVKDARRADRYNQMGLAASILAMQDTGSLEVDPARAGVWMGTGVGGLTTLEAQIVICHTRGADRVTPFLVPMMMANSNAATISMKFGFTNTCQTTATACAAGTQAIGNAAREIATGRATVMLAGGAEVASTPTAVAGFANMTAASSSGISRPFDTERDGFLMAEGAGVVVLEELGHAIARGAHIYGIVSGYGSNADAHHITAPAPHGVGAAGCMELALADAGLAPEQIGHVNAHGTSTQLNDRGEAEAIAKVFGQSRPPVTSIKGALGHSLGAAGAIEAIASCLTFEHGMIPPTANTKNVDPEIDIDVVIGSARSLPDGAIISNSFGFGGHNGSLIFSKYEG